MASLPPHCVPRGPEVPCVLEQRCCRAQGGGGQWPQRPGSHVRGCQHPGVGTEGWNQGPHGGVDNTLGSQVGPGSMDKPHETRKPGGISRTPDLMPCLPTRRPQTPACLSNQREGRREEIRKVKHFLKTLSYHQHGRIKSKGTMIFLTRSVMSAPCGSAL